jgi:dipeptidyl-peptidase-4
MGLPTPEDNLQAYYDANLNNYVDNLGRNLDRYLLIHGTADDNVHYQQSMLLSRTLELKDILFRQQVYYSCILLHRMNFTKRGPDIFIINL